MLVKFIVYLSSLLSTFPTVSAFPGSVSLLFFIYSGTKSGSWISGKNLLSLCRASLIIAQDWGPTFFFLWVWQEYFFLAGTHASTRQGRKISFHLNRLQQYFAKNQGLTSFTVLFSV